MQKVLIAIVLSAATAFAAAAYYFRTTEQVVTSAGAAGTYTFDTSQPVEARIDVLERAVADERLARQLLQEEVSYLTRELERLAPDEGRVPLPPGADVAIADSIPFQPPGDRRREPGTPEDRAERLVAAGFLPSQAAWINQREQELEMEALQARFDAERSGEDIDWMANRTMASDALREELGDADYERYLEANGRSTSIAVSSVIESSPAQTAGLMPGDQIIRYDGERVFSMTDLTRQTMTGEPGQTVVVDVMRNGNLMQVVMPRGPVGITGGRRRF